MLVASKVAAADAVNKLGQDPENHHASVGSADVESVEESLPSPAQNHPVVLHV